ncbi:acetyl/propionyl/methylcrotonyl-CoA carboxylase subunit alpha [Ciceribacter sp. RN22]|uniref:acetyl/propionyl/methylcrotonyl-CoA carboxylase subunit alpha n=1 Tax=Ciceribacter sp. RN22 TaxID=2954932 RepID=UPI0020938D71|nr:acetyl/propionyl/methylcrotonyl-CoA carboxylase subunit alpha [Ciceribacter sp. RN22]MCO6179572.1 acetyl/propionyl/methylcrotonyl-CoA carboxylase subunit alpha [Ciceribacter sp. RN22]
MFSKILIANRGEIAVRIIKTARRLGIRTVAVYSRVDRDALHVALADEAVFLGAAPATESYLDIGKVVAAALASGAEAIHPGYGFLSENPDFVDAVGKASLTFIGPDAASIRAMGLKDAAKRLMEEAGVPVVPGYHGDNQDAAFLKLEAGKIGYPVLIKASAGGGGKGMRRVNAEDDFDVALQSCRREAKSAFGDERVLIEKYISSPRHIEVQVFGDGQGNVVHLFERDCSLQRRHQKVVEEAPAPGMTDAVRAAMVEAAVSVAKAVAYRGAGTVEFIADGSGPLRQDGFWFMEMNTRLQVEHPVTEMVTGFDLIEWQLRVAAGEPLPVQQDEIRLLGHAAEARLYAEDPANGFLPQAGRIDHLEFGSGEGIRVDAGVRAGDQVSPYYDPMIAKVIAHGKSRDEAIDRLKNALDGTHITGLTSNRDFLRALCRDEIFRQGRMDTGLIERSMDSLVARPDVPEEAILIAALAASGLDPSGPHCGFRLWGEVSHRVAMHAGEEIIERRIVSGGGRVRLSGGNEEVLLEEIAFDGRTFSARLVRENGSDRVLARLVVDVHGGERRISVLLDGETYAFERPDPLEGEDAAHHHSGEILAPMTGIVRLVDVGAGVAVKAGDRLVVMEAMKMEYTLRSPRDGLVDAVFCIEGGQAEGGAVLIRITEERLDG